MRPMVYLGPSLPVENAKKILDADYYPPIRRGDLLASVSDQPILIIDGEFKQSLSVSPKEILNVIDRGDIVIGSSSMGALRATELSAYGMKGVGWVYEAYKSGKIIGDDEVALIFSSFDGSPLTIPLVNIRCWLERLETRGLIDNKRSRKIIRYSKAIFYAERTPTRLYKMLEKFLGRKFFYDLLKEEGGSITDIKAEDARAALKYVANIVGS